MIEKTKRGGRQVLKTFLKENRSFNKSQNQAKIMIYKNNL